MMNITPVCDINNCKKAADKYVDNKYLCGKHHLEMVSTGQIKDDARDEYEAEKAPNHLFNGS